MIFDDVDEDGDRLQVLHSGDGFAFMAHSKSTHSTNVVNLSKEQVERLIAFLDPSGSDARWARRIQTLEARLDAVRKAADGK